MDDRLNFVRPNMNQNTHFGATFTYILFCK